MKKRILVWLSVLVILLFLTGCIKSSPDVGLKKNLENLSDGELKSIIEKGEKPLTGEASSQKIIKIRGKEVLISKVLPEAKKVYDARQNAVIELQKKLEGMSNTELKTLYKSVEDASIYGHPESSVALVTLSKLKREFSDKSLPINDDQIIGKAKEIYKIRNPARNPALDIKKLKAAYTPRIQIARIDDKCLGQKGCVDTDLGLQYAKYIEGRVLLPFGLQTKTDYCENNEKVIEYYCDGNNSISASLQCDNGCYQGSCKYLGCSKFLDKECITVTRDCSRFVVFAPEGYGLLAKGHLQDLEYCYPALSEFIGITPLYEWIIPLNLAIADFFRGSSDGITLNYQAPESAWEDRLNEFLTNDPDGFLGKSSPDYCANAHELTHVFTGLLPLPEWASEGIAEYTQKYKQPGSKDYIECREEGWYGEDMWGDGREKLFPYFDLFPGNRDPNSYVESVSFYHTSMCLWEYVDKYYGAEKRKEIFQKLKSRRNQMNNNYDEIRGIWEDQFVNAIMRPVLGDQAITELQNKFGI